jgi:hypothetical protein
MCSSIIKNVLTKHEQSWETFAAKNPVQNKALDESSDRHLHHRLDQSRKRLLAAEQQAELGRSLKLADLDVL